MLQIKTKDDAICHFLQAGVVELRKRRIIQNNEDEQLYTYQNEKYLVLTNDEATKVASAKIMPRMYEFSTESIMKYLDKSFGYGIIACIQSFGPESGVILKNLMGNNYGNFVSHICFNVDRGRAKFISTRPDEPETKIGLYFIYRL